MTRAFRSEAELAALLTRPGYGVREQFRSAELLEDLAAFHEGPPPALPVPESAVLEAVLECLRRHPAVAWAQRFNTGGFRNPSGQYVAMGFEGCSDVLGQLKNGKLLAVECKSDTGKLTDPQREFLTLVARNHGIAIVARGVDDVIAGLRRA